MHTRGAGGGAEDSRRYHDARSKGNQIKATARVKADRQSLGPPIVDVTDYFAHDRVERYRFAYEIIRGCRSVREEVAARRGRRPRPAWVPEFSIIDRNGNVVVTYAAPPITASTTDEELQFVYDTGKFAKAASFIMAIFWLEANIDPTRT